MVPAPNLPTRERSHPYTRARTMTADADATTIVLTGFMGTGKSTIGRLLAQRLGLDFVDTDELIEARHGPIPGIFAAHGEDCFRSLERRLAEELGSRTGLVVATGGRFMLDPANRAAMEPGARVFCLEADVDEILRRVLAHGVDRPLLEGPDPAARIAELLDERAAGYAAFEQVPTGGRRPAEIVDDIVERLDPA